MALRLVRLSTLSQNVEMILNRMPERKEVLYKQDKMPRVAAEWCLTFNQINFNHMTEMVPLYVTRTNRRTESTLVAVRN